MFDNSLLFNQYFWFSLMMVFLVLEVASVSGIFLSLGVASFIIGVVLLFVEISFIGLLSLIFISLLVSYFVGTKIFKMLERRKKDDDEEPINN